VREEEEGWGAAAEERVPSKKEGTRMAQSLAKEPYRRALLTRLRTEQEEEQLAHSRAMHDRVASELREQRAEWFVVNE